MLSLSAVVLWSNFALLALSDNLELLSGSLRQLQRAGCQELSLSCPQGTSIALVSAKYSKGVFCPGVEYNRNCPLPSSLQYSLLQTAIEKCQKKRHCKLIPSSTSYGTDPCPSKPKHLHVIYTCRPYEFRSKTACENEVVQLGCGPNSRLAIYSASYGRTQYESLQCPQPPGVPEETCLAGYTTETVIDLCHGKRRCSLPVDSSVFGKPCQKESKVYLKVVYTCVARQVLLAKLEQPSEADEPPDPGEPWPDYDEEEEAAPNTSGHRNNDSGSLYHIDFMPTYPADEEDKSTGKVSRDLRLQILPDQDVINCTVNIYTDSHRSVIGFISEWISVYQFLSNNKERLSLYLAVSIGGGLVCVLSLLAVRLAWSSRQRSRAQQHQGPPFVGELYEGETDLAIATALPPDPSEVVRYSSGNSQYYYG